MAGSETLTDKAVRMWESDSPNRSQLPISVAATSTALPANVVEMAQIKTYLDIVFPMSEARRSTMLEVIENTKIDKRYTIFPADYTVTPRSLEQTSKEYIEHSVLLGRRAAADCLEQAGLKATEIDLLIT